MAGLFKLGKFVRLIPHPVMLGFVNGLAIVIFLAQLSQFKFMNSLGESEWLKGSDLVLMLGLVGVTMLIIHFLPKLTKSIPLLNIATVTGLVLLHGNRTVPIWLPLGVGSFAIFPMSFNSTLKIFFINYFGFYWAD